MKNTDDIASDESIEFIHPTIASTKEANRVALVPLISPPAVVLGESELNPITDPPPSINCHNGAAPSPQLRTTPQKHGAHLLIEESPLLVLPSLAKAIGLDQAIVVQQIHYWLKSGKSGKCLNGHQWIYNTYAEWQKQFSWWEEWKIKRIFNKLEKKGLVISCQPERGISRRKYYRLGPTLTEMLKNSVFITKFPKSNHGHEIVPLTAQNRPLMGTQSSVDEDATVPPMGTNSSVPSTESTNREYQQRVSSEKSSSSPLAPSGAKGENEEEEEILPAKNGEVTRLSNSTAIKESITTWFGRLQSLAWTKEESKALEGVLALYGPQDTDTLDNNLDILEWYYTQSGCEFLRRTPLALLNNWKGDIGRAETYKSPTTSN